MYTVNPLEHVDVNQVGNMMGMLLERTNVVEQMQNGASEYFSAIYDAFHALLRVMELFYASH